LSPALHLRPELVMIAHHPLSESRGRQRQSPLLPRRRPLCLSAAFTSSSSAKMFASVHVPAAGAPVDMADVSAETVLDAAVVSVLSSPSCYTR